MTANLEFSYDTYLESAEFIKKNVSFDPLILIILGSGLGTLVNIIKNPITLSYKDIPNFPVSTVEGHVGQLVFGTLSNVKVVCMQGRIHHYEGYNLQQCTFPIRVMSLLGIKIMMVTNAAGGLNPDYKIGDVMLIKDHISFMEFSGNSPLRGPNELKFGPRFPSMNHAYDKGLLRLAKEIAKKTDLHLNLQEGVYTMIGGPAYETIAEGKALRILGADVVGMSTIPEVLVAKHNGMLVFGFSLVSDIVASTYEDKEPSHHDVLEAVTSRIIQLEDFISLMVESIGANYCDAA